MYKVLVRVIGILTLATVGGCAAWLPSFYEVPVRQGNYIDRAMVAQLRPGMSRRQVQATLGTPLLTDPFHENRWDYVYNLQRDGELVEERHVTLFFEGDSLNRVEGGDTLPAPKPPAGQ